MTILSDPRGTMPMRSGIGEPDFGTPKSESDVMVSVTIDGETHTVPEGTSVMRAAGEAGCAIPKLCATDSLQPVGSCRMCIVLLQSKTAWLFAHKLLKLQNFVRA